MAPSAGGQGGFITGASGDGASGDGVGAAAGDGGIGDGGTPGAAGDGGEAGVGNEPPSVVSLSVQLADSCASFSDRSLKCWGDWNAYGTADQPYHFGLQVPVSRELPLKIVSKKGVEIVQVATSLSHTCVRLSDGTVTCWGSNQVGQLGRGNTQDEHNPSMAAPISINPDPGDAVEQIVVGQIHTCALLASKRVKCWGINDDGRLGLGHVSTIGDDELPSSAPAVSVSTELGVHVEKLFAGPMNTCALLSNGHMKCWGKSSYGELGDGYLGQRMIGDDELPSSIADTPLTNPGESLKDLVIGYHHMCLLLTSGPVRCWGRSDILGYGLGAPKLPQRATDAAPVSVAPPGLSVTALSAGWFHTCALISDGAVRCWGINGSGQLGLGNTQPIGDDELPSDAPAVRLTNVPGVTVVALSNGQGHHTCALLSDGSVKCWGDGIALGQNGTAAVGDDESPASVPPIAF